MLPIIALIVTIIVSFFGVSVFAMIFPQIQAFLFCIAFGVLALLTSGVYIYEGKKVNINAGAIFAGLAGIIMLCLFFNIPVPSFANSIYSVVLPQRQLSVMVTPEESCLQSDGLMRECAPGNWFCEMGKIYKCDVTGAGYCLVQKCNGECGYRNDFELVCANSS